MSKGKSATLLHINVDSQESIHSGQISHAYSVFEKINGMHTWMQAVPEGYITYPVRKLNHGKVVYFNYNLAKEMGLISLSHAHQMNSELHNRIIDTFSLQIINEYDQITQRRIAKKDIKANSYMATRYLQLQHSDKRGRTSGDGRGIWNGQISYNNKVWDVSSRGTGVTRLAPGAVIANKPLKTGNTEIGYGCGLAEIDELYGAAIMSEIFYFQGYNTERVLTIIDLGNGIGIGVRASLNLFRPAHIFLHLKQNNFSALKRSVDYVIDRQIQNKQWNIHPYIPYRYEDFLKNICHDFARFAAHLDVDYIFAWLDWDGDNVLINGGIIDYGSIRQFGLRHDQYRYDDIERFSTNLNEQRGKARFLVQVFAQITDYLITQNKKPLKSYRQHPILKEFDQEFETQKLQRLLYQLGFNHRQRQILMDKHLNNVKNFAHIFRYFESVKTHKPKQKVEDGINRPAIYNMRNILRLLPKYLYENKKPWDKCYLNPSDFFNIMLAKNITAKDRQGFQSVVKKIISFQDEYKKLINHVALTKSPQQTLRNILQRTKVINRPNRLTGNALVNIVDEIIRDQKQKKNQEINIQNTIDQIIFDQSCQPETLINHNKRLSTQISNEKINPNLFRVILRLAEDFREDI